MPNERLRAALSRKGLTLAGLAEEVGVDPKTVERWITKGRPPYRTTREKVANLLELKESYLWPDALSTEQVASASSSELVTIYPNRSDVPRDAWGRLFAEAREEIGVLVYAGLFLSEDVSILRTFAEKARAGVRVRILLGDPDSAQVAERGADEGVGEAMAAKIHNALVLYRPIMGIEGVEFRFHRTVLYNSIYRADDQLLVNTHVYGITAAYAPVWHMRRVSGGELTETYIDSFERVWGGAEPMPLEG